MVLLLTHIVFLCWVHAANRNAHALGARGMQFTPGWSVGWFFIPVLNLVRPYQVVKEICQASDPDKDRDNWLSSPVPGFFLVWWILWLLGNSLGNMAFRLQLSPLLQNPRAVGVILAIGATGSFFSMIAALVAAAVVRVISNRQEAKANQATMLEPSDGI